MDAPTPEEQVEAEARLANRLLAASDDERGPLYGSVYDEIYAMSLPRLGDTAEAQTFGASPVDVALLEATGPESGSTLEIGCGSGYLTLALADRGIQATGADVSEIILDQARLHAAGRAEFVHLCGIRLPFPDKSFDFAFSVEMIEHLHERDAVPHLREVRRVLRPGGRYLICTPNRHYTGNSAADRWGVGCIPNGDVHLKEWVYRELIEALYKSGFRRTRHVARIPKLGRIGEWPTAPAVALEGHVGTWLAMKIGINHIRLIASR